MMTTTVTTYPLDVRRPGVEQKAMASKDGAAGRALRRLSSWECLAIWHGQAIGTRYLPCPLCAEMIDMHNGDEWDSEHAISEYNGGLSTATNLIAACVDCNAAKGDDLSLPHYRNGVMIAGSQVTPARGSDALVMLRTLGVIKGNGGRRSTESPFERSIRRAKIASIWQ